MLIFTYGTLKRGFSNNYLLSTSKFISNGVTKDKFGLFPSACGRFPFALESISDTNIKGEIWEISKKTERQLDILEGFPFLYTKKKVKIKNDINETVTAIMYIKNEDFYPDAINYDIKINEWK